jgi:hypothetical protein
MTTLLAVVLFTSQTCARDTYTSLPVGNEGSLLIGSPTCSLRNKVTINLYSSRGAQALPAESQVKGIAVSSRIDIHGMQYFLMWSRLAMTAEAGDKYLFIRVSHILWEGGQGRGLLLQAQHQASTHVNSGRVHP